MVQSRPITNLPVQPLRDVSWAAPEPTDKLVRRQIVENMPDPLSPLFEELYLHDGLEDAIDDMWHLFHIPISPSALVMRPLFLTVNGYAYCRANYRGAWRLALTIPGIVWWYVRYLPKFLRQVVPMWRDEGLPQYQEVVERCQAIELPDANDEQLLAAIRELAKADARYWFYASVVLGAAKVTDGLLQWFVSSKKLGLASAQFLRGFPAKTLQPQEDLERIANLIRDQDSVCKLVTSTRANDLLEVLGQRLGGYEIRQELEQHFDQYGHQIYNLDFADPTQVEYRIPVLQQLKSLVATIGPGIVERQVELASQREQLVQETRERLGPIRRRAFNKLLSWAQGFGPYREEALFFVGLGWPTLRRIAAELGTRLVQAALIDEADDVFFLRSEELTQAINARRNRRSVRQLRRTAQARRDLREARKPLHPPGMIPENSRLTIGPFDLSRFETQRKNPENATTLKGFPVSPGMVTGTACVIMSSLDFPKMQADMILVCPTTTPAWTPLLGQSIGLVTDIGGILAHGSIVAREYGIPAVLGTGNATKRIVSGQRITVDGNRGTITVLDD